MGGRANGGLGRVGGEIGKAARAGLEWLGLQIRTNGMGGRSGGEVGKKMPRKIEKLDDGGQEIGSPRSA